MHVQLDVSQVRSQRKTWSRRRGRGTRPRRGERRGRPQARASVRPPALRRASRWPMRLGVLDIGSNTGPPAGRRRARRRGAAAGVLAQGAAPARRAPRRRRARSPTRASTALTDFVGAALVVAEDKGCEEMLGFATSAVRDADQQRRGARPRARADRRRHRGAARRGRGPADLPRRTPVVRLVVGRLAVFDIGGGSLEIAVGSDEAPDVAQSLPLGAGRLTRDWLRRADPTRTTSASCASRSAPRSPATPGTVLRAGVARPRGGDVQDVPLAGPDLRRGAVGRRAAGAPVLPQRRAADWIPS